MQSEYVELVLSVIIRSVPEPQAVLAVLRGRQRKLSDQAAVLSVWTMIAKSLDVRTEALVKTGSVSALLDFLESIAASLSMFVQQPIVLTVLFVCLT